jgi:heme exporter protein C
MRKNDILHRILWILTTAGMFVALWMVFRYAPEEKVMGAAQKIFYFHVPTAIMTYLSVFVLLAGSIGYLWTRRTHWDHLARAGTEIGVVLCALTLISGSIWAKPAWGIWWAWEARLTTFLVMGMLLVGALMVRGYATNRDVGARLAAVVGIVAAIDIPIVHKAVEWWRGHHPQVFAPGKSEGLAPEMRDTFLVCMLVFLLLTTMLILLRYRQALAEERSEVLRERMADLGMSGGSR